MTVTFKVTVIFLSLAKNNYIIPASKYYSFEGQTIVNEYKPATNDWHLSYLLTDHLGSVVAVTDGTGALLSQQRYLPFGGERTNIGTISQTDYGYTGQRDMNMGLMDYKARFYSPILGRFTQPDSMTPGGPQGLNRYSYVSNNPVNFNDQTGHVMVGNDDMSKGCIIKAGCSTNDKKAEKKYKDDKKRNGLPTTPYKGPCLSVVCTDPLSTGNGSAISDPSYPTYLPPSSWEPNSADVSPHQNMPTPGISGFLLFFDLLSSFTYSDKIEKTRGFYLFAEVNYKTTTNEYGMTYREPTSLKIFNNSGHPMNVKTIRTEYYELQNTNFAIPNKGVVIANVNASGLFVGDNIRINLNYQNFYAQINVSLYGN
jgi:RHS repeat-associated protein